MITLTLMVFIFQFRSQEKAIKDAAYQNVQSHYTDYVRMLVEKPELTKLLTFSQASRLKDGSTEKLSPEEETVQAYILLGYGIFEEVYTLYKKKWIDEETWNQWTAFLKIYAKHPLFRRIHEGTRGTFDPEFYSYVTKVMDEKD